MRVSSRTRPLYSPKKVPGTQGTRSTVGPRSRALVPVGRALFEISEEMTEYKFCMSRFSDILHTRGGISMTCRTKFHMPSSNGSLGITKHKDERIFRKTAGTLFYIPRKCYPNNSGKLFRALAPCITSRP